MKKLISALILCTLLGLHAVPSAGQGFMNEPGALLAYPLIDNINGITIVNIANVCSVDIVLECYMITHGGDETIDEKKDFVIEMTGKEKFLWVTNRAYNQRGNQIQGFDNRVGYMFCFMIDDKYSQLEDAVNGNCIKGDATLVEPANARAWQYNAIPHQARAVLPNRVLNLDGGEYSAVTSQVMFEGLAEVHGAIYGTLAVASPGRGICGDDVNVCTSDYDFILSQQPEFDINIYCWNEVETKFSRHLHFKDFERYDLTRDLQLDVGSIFTLGFHCATTSTHPLWAVFHQNLAGVFGWGGNVFQQPGTDVPAVIVLPPVPVAQ